MIKHIFVIVQGNLFRLVIQLYLCGLVLILVESTQISCHTGISSLFGCHTLEVVNLYGLVHHLSEPVQVSYYTGEAREINCRTSVHTVI